MVGRLQRLVEALESRPQFFELVRALGLRPDRRVGDLLVARAVALIVADVHALDPGAQAEAREQSQAALELGLAADGLGEAHGPPLELEGGRGVGARHAGAELKELFDGGVVLLERRLELEGGRSVLSPGRGAREPLGELGHATLEGLGTTKGAGDGQGGGGHFGCSGWWEMILHSLTTDRGQATSIGRERSRIASDVIAWILPYA